MEGVELPFVQYVEQVVLQCNVEMDRVTLGQRYWKRLFRSANLGRFRDVSGYP